MSRLPVIVGFGGVNAAGRSSGHHGFRRMVVDALPAPAARATWASLAGLTGRPGEPDESTIGWLREHSLIRRLEPEYFDVERVPWNRRLKISPAGEPVRFSVSRRQLPDVVPPEWRVTPLDDRRVSVEIDVDSELLVGDERRAEVSAAGQLPTGFDPQSLYQARNHPRGLQLAIYAISDAIGAMGIDWATIAGQVRADAISVYGGSCMGQLDTNGTGGMIASRYQGKRVTSKQLALGLADMPADFVNAYVLGNMGSTGAVVGACATFFYNLRQGVNDIRSGRARVAVIGGAEAPITPEVMDGYLTMGALGTDASLRGLDGLDADTEPDLRRACRPFSANCGFTLAEGAQYVILMDDELALELGAQVFGAVADVFVNADGHKKSISAPGVGNYITVAKAVALARAVVGDEAVRRRSFVHAHGTGTPQNRVTESHILDEVARAFEIEQWPVAAIKCYVGHTLAVAGGDQLASALGTWAEGIIPGIATIDHIAEDVSCRHLSMAPEHREVDPKGLDVAFLNAKGFGGNNATAAVLAPHIAESMLARRHGAKAISAWRERAETARRAAEEHDRNCSAGKASPVYRYDFEVRHGDHVHVSPSTVVIDGCAGSVDLQLPNPYADMSATTSDK